MRVHLLGRVHHISLGQGPGGKAWTAIASPYWPAVAAVCSFCKPCKAELILAPPHSSGFGVAPNGLSIKKVLEQCRAVASGGATIHASAIRVAAGSQPPGRLLQTWLPEGLGQKEHLGVALGLQHQVARPAQLQLHVHHALDNKHADPLVLNMWMAGCDRSLRPIILLLWGN